MMTTRCRGAANIWRKEKLNRLFCELYAPFGPDLFGTPYDIDINRPISYTGSGPADHSHVFCISINHHLPHVSNE
jgi:hypothetical protein